MSVLRIYGSLRNAPERCQWALVAANRDPVLGEGRLAQLPRRAESVQLIVPAEEVLITRTRLPATARRRASMVLAYAVEEKSAGDPDANQVSWLGSVGDADVLAVADRQGLKRWHEALDAVGIRNYELHCETLMLPWAAGEWSLAWNGRDGFVRTGRFEGTTTDCGDPKSPPLSLRMMVEDAKSRGAAPSSIAVYANISADRSDAPLDIEAWQRALGVALRWAGTWDWRMAPPEAGVSLAQESAGWRLPRGTFARLRPLAWIAGTALVIHALALVVDWTRLASEQRGLRQQMESRFRAAFPEAVAVADPALQMRRKLVEARHAAGLADATDFLPMITQVAAALKAVPAGTLRVLSYEAGRMTLELNAIDEAAVGRIMAQLRQYGLHADAARPAAQAKASTVILTVRSS